MRAKWVLLSVAVVLAGALALWLAMRSHRAAPPPVRLAGAAVIVNREITLQGTIRPQHVVGVAAPLTGLVEGLPVDIGQEVYRDQVLARVGGQGLESAREAAAADLEHAQDQTARAEAGVTTARLEESRADADVERARLALDRAEKTYSRQRTLFAQGATPRLTFEKAESEYRSLTKEFEIMDAGARGARDQVQNALREVTAKKKIVQDRQQQLEEAQGNLQAAEVRSPVDGTVVGRRAEIGKPAYEAGAGFFQIATDLYALEVTLEPKPEELKRIQPGQQAMVLILDLQSQGLPGVVREIKGSQVVVEFESNLPAIKPGMVAGVRLKLE
ncbi:MAG TPA: HlyD family efflux transporter periplasmic adaptor subunit [Candidatus Acidoferrales bacterium]|jgi:HlyD family secretion protein|nr:HlyD family efflux transporter periplasmic adaptor subunit [Candidatus Acidoferrales bacterium]